MTKKHHINEGVIAMAKKTTHVRSSEQHSDFSTGVATARVTDAARPAPELERLNVFIGRWITEGETAGSAEASSARILASDVYQWAPGGHFVMHPAYGRIGNFDVGGLEVIGYDSATGQYRTHFFDSQGNVITETLSCRNGIWTWQGERV